MACDVDECRDMTNDSSGNAVCVGSGPALLICIFAYLHIWIATSLIHSLIQRLAVADLHTSSVMPP